MNELQLPEQLSGRWQNALFLTYGLDVPFFESAVWRQLSPGCRNKIILADGDRYLEACDIYAQSGVARHLNQQYVAEGIFATRAAHAKVILLTNEEQGRLLIGSGNLNWQGYASGGELFTQYEYGPEVRDSVNAFLVVGEVLGRLIEHGHIGPAGSRRIRHLLERTPWLYQAPAGGQRPVRHNFDKSFLEQLQETIGGDTVQELWILSPFYDKGMVALERTIEAIRPGLTTLLIQASNTSADPAKLQRILDRYPDRCRVRPFSMGTDSPYVHAKLYLVKLPNRAICLQGSPNLTQTAMLLTAQRGNLEIANLLTGKRDTFDYLLDSLEIAGETAEIDSLDLSFQETEAPEGIGDDGWALTGGEWFSDRLDLVYKGTAPELGNASLVIGEHAFSLEVVSQQAGTLRLVLPAEAGTLLTSPVPVHISWTRGDATLSSNPVFVCNRTALDKALAVTEGGESLGRVGDLDLDDQELEQLLAELDAALMIDRRSVWRLAERTPPSAEDEDDEQLRLDYLDVDYEALRKHPKIRQYMRGALGAGDYAASRLQLILNAITDHFDGLVSPQRRGASTLSGLAEPVAGQAETSEEQEEEAEAQEKRRRSQMQRVRRLLKNFIRRYLRGIRSPDFQELAGYEVIANNYAIFSHLLWRIFSKEWVEPEFIVDSLLNTWEFFWGGHNKAGYYRKLSREQQGQVLELLLEYHADAVLLAATYYCAWLTRLGHWPDRRFLLRDFWRDTLCRPVFDLTAALLEDAWRVVADLIPYQTPPPSEIAHELEDLARFTTRERFLGGVEEQYRYPRGSCEFDKQSVWRERLDRKDIVDCLVIKVDDALQETEGAIQLLRWWMQIEALDYYRILNAVNGWVIYYDATDRAGLYWGKDRDDETALGPIDPLPASWTAQISYLQTLADELDDELPAMLAETPVDAH